MPNAATTVRINNVIRSSHRLSAPTSRRDIPQGPPMGIDAPLVDAEGFPRGDIDVYRARTLRKRFKEVQTDLRSLDERLERGLLEVAALASGEGEEGGGGIKRTTAKEDEEERAARRAPKPKPKYDAQSGKWVVRSWDGSVAGVEDGERRSFEDLGREMRGALSSIAGGGGRAGGGDGDVVMSESEATGPRQASTSGQPRRSDQRTSFQEPPAVPFVVIDEVAPNSPAGLAGLQEGDLLLRFGDVDASNHDDFRAIAALVSSAAREGSSIPVAVRRKTSELGGLAEVIRTERAELRPREWGGRGLLGCHIRPYVG